MENKKLTLKDLLLLFTIICSAAGISWSVAIVYGGLHEDMAVFKVQFTDLKGEVEELKGEIIAYREGMKQMEKKVWQ